MLPVVRNEGLVCICSSHFRDFCNWFSPTCREWLIRYIPEITDGPTGWAPRPRLNWDFLKMMKPSTEDLGLQFVVTRGHRGHTELQGPFICRGRRRRSCSTGIYWINTVRQALGMPQWTRQVGLHALHDLDPGHLALAISFVSSLTHYSSLSFVFHFCWRIVDLQCCVSHHHIAKWFSYP